ncbi:MAG TPA: DoxX family protein [Gemmatimonadaceae bacterium]|nr:DoxX family protein [Gemmatimonadaceae bacterium]
MRFLRQATAGQLDLGLAIVRVLTGIILAAHGAQKLFVFGLDGVAGSFGQMGIPMAGLVGPAAAFLEFFGGLVALVAGLLTRLAAFGLAVGMLGALLLVHLKAGFFLPNGHEFVLALLALLAATATLTLTGAGAYAADALLARRRRIRRAPPRSARRAA